ncbi:MAG: LysR family transcriptional regulator [Sphingomonas sp.]|nr:LysR family transcriptional regulator [Sphingomonas sp.]
MTRPRTRHDGWTAASQLRFLEALARTRSVSRAARAAGMSRESAYRLRKREPRGLFAAIWESAMGAGRTHLTRAEIDEGHRRAIAAACAVEARAPTAALAARSTS